MHEFCTLAFTTDITRILLSTLVPPIHPTTWPPAIIQVIRMEYPKSSVRIVHFWELFVQIRFHLESNIRASLIFWVIKKLCFYVTFTSELFSWVTETILIEIISSVTQMTQNFQSFLCYYLELSINLNPAYISELSWFLLSDIKIQVLKVWNRLQKC